MENAEKERDFSNRKIKSQEELIKKLRIEVEQQKQSKKNLNDDLQQLLARRKDIENLQATLVGLI